MTETSREQLVTQALAQYKNQTGMKETLPVPLGGRQTLLEVIALPIDVPVLNANSFRIAPALEDHAQAALVRSEPDSPEAQRVVSDLVRQSHRQVDELKESLKHEGQDQPGVITRKGKLINANTRCVLLRELWEEGSIRTNTIRVAVLPEDVLEPQELQLESVLQKQREHKDEYNLVSELMMIRKLHDDAAMTDAQIASQLRVGGGASRVKALREVLDLMERARRLTTVPLPLAEFISEQDQRQNWLELLGKVKDVDKTEGTAAGDDHIRRWLIAFHLGQSAVHRLRNANGAWVEKDVLDELSEGKSDIGSVLVDSVRNAPAPVAAEPGDALEGLDLFGDDPAPAPDADSLAVQALLDVTVAAKHAGDGEVVLPTGASVPAPDVRDALNASVKNSLEAAKRRADAGNRLQRPGNQLLAARNALKDAADALDVVIDEPQFQSLIEGVASLVDEVAVQLDRINAVLQPDADSDDAFADA